MITQLYTRNSGGFAKSAASNRISIIHIVLLHVAQAKMRENQQQLLMPWQAQQAQQAKLTRLQSKLVRMIWQQRCPKSRVYQLKKPAFLNRDMVMGDANCPG